MRYTITGEWRENHYHWYIQILARPRKKSIYHGKRQLGYTPESQAAVYGQKTRALPDRFRNRSIVLSVRRRPAERKLCTLK
jgi:hypothetical protein